MANELTRMWINQPSTHQPLHNLHGTNVLARHERDNIMLVYFLSGDVISSEVNKNALSKGWHPEPAAAQEIPRQEEVIEVVTGLHKALSRMIDKHNPDSIEAEWLGESNELICKLTGHDMNGKPVRPRMPKP